MGRDLDNFELEDDADRNEGGGLLGLALFALAVGAGAAVLFAPAEGAKTRRIVRARLKGLRGGAEGALERVQRAHAMLRRDRIVVDRPREDRRAKRPEHVAPRLAVAIVVHFAMWERRRPPTEAAASRIERRHRIANATRSSTTRHKSGLLLRDAYSNVTVSDLRRFGSG